MGVLIGRMQMLLPPDTHHLSAAIGWIELGNPTEALLDLDKISKERRQDYEILEVEWVIRAEQKDWDAGLEVARKMLAAAPDQASGWLHQSYAMRRAKEGGIQAAWNALLPAYEKFSDEPTIAYNLACYACQLGQVEECRDWLRRAMKLLGVEKFKEMALNDGDLQPLWDEIRGL